MSATSRRRAPGRIRRAVRFDPSARDLAVGARPAVPARAADGRAPRLGPRELLGRGLTQVGRFRDVDPLRTPRWWSGGRWLGVVIWGLAVGGGLRKAYRLAGGVPGASGDGEATAPERG